MLELQFFHTYWYLAVPLGVLLVVTGVVVGGKQGRRYYLYTVAGAALLLLTAFGGAAWADSARFSPPEVAVAATPLPTPAPTPSPSPTPVVTPTPSPTPTATPTATPSPAPTPAPRELAAERLLEAGLTDLRGIDEWIIIDMRYATDNNFMGQTIYPSDASYLRPGAAERLAKAQAYLLESECRIVVLDAYRPHRYQQVLYDLASDKSFVANPKGASRHNRGAAVDVTLADMEGNILPMPSDYDEFTNRAYRSYRGATDEERANMLLLTEAMTEAGFNTISNEWWHYDDPDYRSYGVLDVDL